MKRAFTITALFFVVQLMLEQTVFSQTNLSQKRTDLQLFVFPTLPKNTKTIDDFAPKGWRIIDEAEGDINKDGIDDVSIVIESQDSIKVEDGYNHPRILLIAFMNSDHYELTLQHNSLIDDSYENMEISKGILRIHYSWDDGRGSGGRLQYVIRYQSNDFYLIGATRESGYHSYISTVDFNFSTKKYVLHEVDDETGRGGKYEEYNKKKDLPPNSLKKLTELKEPFTWKVIDGETI